MKRALAAALVLLVLVGCKKSELTAEDRDAKANAASANAASANADAGAPATASADAGATADAGKEAKLGPAASYGGKYSVAAGTMYVSSEKDWASVKFKNDESKMLGDGEITLSVEPSGRVTGSTSSGPLGESIIEGMSNGGALAATVRRKDPTDDGLTGTLEAKIAGDSLEGTMKLAESNAAVVRVAKLEAKKK